jgi:hypothetical protein
MKCPKCSVDNKSTSKFCSACGTALVPAKGARLETAKPAPRAMAEEPGELFWTPTARWHLVSLAAIYAGLIAVYFALSLFLSKVPDPYRLRDIPQEVTPWLKR